LLGDNKRIRDNIHISDKSSEPRLQVIHDNVIKMRVRVVRRRGMSSRAKGGRA